MSYDPNTARYLCFAEARQAFATGTDTPRAQLERCLAHVSELEPKVQAQIAEFFGEAPANVKACNFTTDPKFCDNYHAADPGFWDNVYYWITPVADCGDDRGEVCKDNNDWVSAWTEIKG